MLDLFVTKETFEFVLPVFSSPQRHLFDRLRHELDNACEDVRALIGDHADKSDNKDVVQSHALSWVCCRAARKMVPQLDLVLTETGFGVVSNQHVVPASQARVAALSENLREKESIAMDSLLVSLLCTPWKDSDAALTRVVSLFWLPLHVRRHGVQWNGRCVYEEEFDMVKPAIALAESKVQTIMSPQVYEHLVEMERLHYGTMEPCFSLLIERTRSLMAMYMREHTARSVQPLVTRLLETLEQYKDKLPEYTTSSTYAARQMPAYQNDKNDSFFFFS